jgi:hypothetical protein
MYNLINFIANLTNFILSYNYITTRAHGTWRMRHATRWQQAHLMCALCSGQSVCVHCAFAISIHGRAAPYFFGAFTGDWNVCVAMTAKHRTTDIQSVMQCRHTKSKQEQSRCTRVTCNLIKLQIQTYKVADTTGSGLNYTYT